MKTKFTRDFPTLQMWRNENPLNYTYLYVDFPLISLSNSRKMLLNDHQTLVAINAPWTTVHILVLFFFTIVLFLFFL